LSATGRFYIGTRPP